MTLPKCMTLSMTLPIYLEHDMLDRTDVHANISSRNGEY